MKQMRIIYFLILTISFNSGFAQTVKTIDSLRHVQQKCLDTGMGMMSCSYVFFNQMDSILNVVYKQYSSCLSVSEKEELKKDELKWLKERDAYFKRADKDCADNIKAGEMPKIMRLINIQDKSAFTEQRVIVLIKRMDLVVESSQH